MNKKKTLVLALLLAVIVVMTSCLFYACNPTGSADEPEKLEATEGLLIQNGDFKMVDQDATSYPRSLNNWSGAKMYSSSSFRDDVIAGAISLDSALYGANKQAWDDADDALRQKLVSGGHGDENDKNKNVLMIYQPKTSKNADGKDQHGPTAYGYTSASFTLSKGSYYVLSVDVLTYGISGSLDEDGNPTKTSEPGARIYVSSNTYAEFAAINTDGEWKTYNIYIETSPVSSTSLTVQLGLGKYTASYSDGLTAGYVFFDNLSLKKLVKEEGNDDIKDDVANIKVADPKAEYTAALNAEETNGGKLEKGGKTYTVATTTLKVPNGRFDFGSYNLSSTGVPNSWTHVTGNSGKDDAAPTGLGYNAIIDTSKFESNFTKYSSNYKTKSGENDKEDLYNPAEILGALGAGDGRDSAIDKYDRVGKNVFMLSQQLMTAQGIRTSRTLTIEKGKKYALTISLFAASIRGAGVSLILSGTDGKDIVIKGIAQNKSDSTYIGGYTLSDPQNGYTNGESVGSGVTSDGWTDYTFYIEGNGYKDYSYTLTIWLGTEGTGSNTAVTYRNFSQSSNATTYTANGTFSTGWLFIDELELNEIGALPSTGEFVGNADSNNTLDVAGTKLTGAIVKLSDAKNKLANYLAPSSETSTLPDSGVSAIGEGVPQDWKSNYDVSDSNNPRIDGFITEGVVNIEDENAFGSYSNIGAYPQLPYENMPHKFAYVMHASQTSYYEVESKPITIEANKFYRISFWLKTVDVKDTSGAYVYVLNKTSQQKNIDEGKGDDEVILTSLTRINTKDYDEYLNDWVEINIVLRGATKEDTDIAFKFTLGTGNRWATSTLATGSMYVANFNMADLTYANYTGTSSSTYTKTCDLSSSFSYQFTNGSFDNYDLDDENLDEQVNHLYDQKVPASPDSWTVNDATLEMNKEDKALYAGVVQLKEDEPAEGEELPENFFFSASNQIKAATGINDDPFFNNFYGDKANKPSYYEELNMKSIAGPNLLALGSKSNEKFAIGFASTSFTLSSNTYNVLSLYAKTYGPTKASIRLTGEASGSGSNSGKNNFLIDNTSEAAGTGWTKYVFFIKVGKNSVSLKLNLWLGEDVQYILDRTDDNEDEYNAAVEAAKSAGHVFFDNINSYTIEDEDKYNEAIKQEETNGSKVNKLDFQVDSFDPLSSSVDSHRTLTSPNGWSGAAGTNQSSSNTKAGIVYTGDSSYYETETVGGVEYAKLLGKEYTEENDDYTPTAEEITAYKEAHPQYATADDYVVRDLIVTEHLNELKANNWIPVEQLRLGAKSGDHMLVINNMTKSAYTYTSASNTLSGNKWYRISVNLRTYGLNNAGNDDDFKEPDISDEELATAKASGKYEGLSDDKIKAALLREKKKIGAYIELYLGSANETGNEFSFEAVISDGVWTTYNFFVQTNDDDVTSVTIKLSLGRYINEDIDGKSVTNGLTTGYAMFDDISIDEVTEDDFTAIYDKVRDPEGTAYDAEAAKTNRARIVTSTESGTPTDPETPSTTPGSGFNLEYLWWMIPTIVLGLVIIIVLVIFMVRKLRKATPKTVKIKKAASEPTSAQTLDEKRERYDSDKE